MTGGDRALITHSRLVADLRALRVDSGQVVMLQTSFKSVGKVMGGPNGVIQSLLEARCQGASDAMRGAPEAGKCEG